MRPIIKDLAKPTTQPEIKPINLIACLQAQKNSEGDYHFYKSNYESVAIHTITRLAKNVVPNHDLILVNDETLFLGHWNDGVL